MRKEDIENSLHDQATRDIPNVDLWHRIQDHVQAKHMRSRQNTPLYRRLTVQLTAFGLIAILLVGGIVLSTPTTRASVSQMFQRFGVVLVDWTTEPEIVGDAQPAQPAPESSPVEMGQDISLAEAQQLVPFHIPQPTHLPNDVELTGVWVGKSSYSDIIPPSIQIGLTYRPKTVAPDREGANVRLDIIEGTEERGGYSFPASAAQATTVHDQPAVYVSGSWRYEGGWNEQSDYHVLSWQADGFTYVLHVYRLGLQQEDLVQIAESLQ